MTYDNLHDRVKYMNSAHGPAEAFRLEQYGNLDLSFDGWIVSDIIGEPSEVRPTVDIRLFYTTAGRYVGHISRTLPSSKEHPMVVTKSRAAAFPSPLEILAWLKEDGRGFLGTNSKFAWEELCGKLPWLSKSATVRA